MGDDNTNGLNFFIEDTVFLDQNELQKNIQKVKEIYNWGEQEKVLLEVYGGLKNEL